MLETNINNLTSTTTSVATNNNATNRPVTSPTSATASHDIPNVAFKVEHVMTPDICTAGRFGSFRSEFSLYDCRFKYTLLNMLFQVDWSPDGKLPMPFTHIWLV